MSFNMTDKQKKIGGAVIAVAVAIIIYCGYGSSISQVNECRATVSTYVTAEYSETNLVTGIDMDGNMYSEMETDYWSEPASETYTAITINGTLFTQGAYRTTVRNAAHYPPIPRHNTAMSRHTDFDNFQQHVDSTLKVYVTDDFTGEGSDFSEPIIDNPKCIDKVNAYVSVKTWYGITYGSDF